MKDFGHDTGRPGSLDQVIEDVYERIHAVCEYDGDHVARIWQRDSGLFCLSLYRKGEPMPLTMEVCNIESMLEEFREGWLPNNWVLEEFDGVVQTYI